MGKSEFSAAVDTVQQLLRPWLRERGFRSRARTFNRVTPDGLTHVVSFQMGSFDPPGTLPIPGFRENLYGRFTINLGVFVPEVGLVLLGPPTAWVTEPYCCLRARLGGLSEGMDLWWPANASGDVVDDVRDRLGDAGLPWLDRFDSRDRVLAELPRVENTNGGRPPRIIAAIILAARGQAEQARALLEAQASESRVSNPQHVKHVRGLSLKLGLGQLPE